MLIGPSRVELLTFLPQLEQLTSVHYLLVAHSKRRKPWCHVTTNRGRRSGGWAGDEHEAAPSASTAPMINSEHPKGASAHREKYKYVLYTHILNQTFRNAEFP